MATQPPSNSAPEGWLASARDAIAQVAGLEPAALNLDPATVHSLLNIARLAAHESGDRRNAPLVCYLIGQAGRGVDLEALAAKIEHIS